jgi:FAD/FMN-containing dehydrogenase
MNATTQNQLTALSRVAGPDAADLARRLAQETQGEVFFDAASRGRYATDASIYQITPTGVFVPRNDDDVAVALAIARELRTPVLSRGAGTSQCGQTTGASLVIDHSKYLRHCCRTARPGAGRAERPTQALGPVVPGGRVDQRAGHAGWHGRQQLVRLAQHRLRQHGAQRVGH